MKAASHPGAEQLTGYLLGKLSWSEMEKVEIHLGSCTDCRSHAEGLEESDDSFVSCLRGNWIGQKDHAELDQLLSTARGITQETVSAVAAAPRQKVAGHELLRELARGGLGVVYLARHLLLNDLRAIKRPQVRDGLERDHMLARFRREVEAVGALRHDHIVRAHDAGADDEGPYLVAEYLDGEPLSRLCTRRRLLHAEACELVRQAALGLQAAHERGLVHRDVKPSNLMLARASSGARVVVIDWGLVKRAGEGGMPQHPPAEGPTASGTAMGTPDYMAPEQIRDARAVDIRADIYSLGATLYCLLAGKPPFHGRPALEKLLAHQREAFPPLDRVRADIPREVLAVLNKMAEKDPSRRHVSAAAVADALQPHCCSAERLLDLLDGQDALPRPLSVPARRWRTVWVLVSAASLLLACVTLGLLWRNQNLPAKNEPDGDGVAAVSSAVLGDGPAFPVSMSGHPGPCSSLAFTADGLSAISESGGGNVFVWDLQKRRLRDHPWPHAFGKPLQDISGMVAVSPDGSLIAAAGINSAPRHMLTLSLYDQKTYQRVGKDFAFTRMGRVLAFSADGSRLATVDLPGVLNQFLQPVFGSGGIRVRIIDVPTGTWKEFPIASSVNSLAFSPDGKLLVTCSDEKNLRLWNVPQGQQERELPGHAGGVDQVAFSADGQRIFSASGADDTLRVWKYPPNDRDARAEVKQISIRKVGTKLSCCTFWKGGRALTGHGSGKVVLWDLDMGKELYQFEHKDVQVTALAISPDGNHALTALSDRSVSLHRLPAPHSK